MVLPFFGYFHFYLLEYPFIKSSPNVTLMSILLCLLSMPIQWYVGKDFYKSAFIALKHKTTNMSTLIAVGTTIVWIYAFITLILAFFDVKNDDHLIHQSQSFFQTSSVIITIILFGKWLQAKAKYYTCNVISMLMELQPLKAHQIQLNEYGQIINYIDTKNDDEISLELLNKDDIIKVFEGESIPLDGTIIYGESTIDESMVTGESLPRHVKIGDKVIGSSINCGNTYIIVRIDKLKSECMISKIINIIKTSQFNKPKQQDLADKVSSYFVPCILAASLFTFIAWYIALAYRVIIIHNDANNLFNALEFGVSVIVIACPCAFGLAIPTAVMVGIGIASKYGILIKGGDVLEVAYNIHTIVFDKTGTLTNGKPIVKEFEQISDDNSISLVQLILLAGSAELNSQHPLGKAIVKYSKHIINLYNDKNKNKLNESLVTPISFKSIPGKGIQSNIDNKNIKIGNYKWIMDENNTKFPNSVDKNYIQSQLSNAEQKGYITLLMCIENELHALISLFDSPKKESKQLINVLHNRPYNINTVMLTGDNKKTALAIAKYLNINEGDVISQCLPQNKHEIIKELQLKKWSNIDTVPLITNSNEYNKNQRRNNNNNICMVGDGINDALALKQANLGIGIGTGTDIAIECSDVVLLNNNLFNIITLIDLSRKIINRIYLNFIYAFGFNIIGIPIAAGLFYPAFKIKLKPQYSAIIMALSSLCVVTSSLLLRLYKPPHRTGNITNPLDSFINNIEMNIDLIALCGCGLNCQCRFKGDECGCENCVCGNSVASIKVIK